MATLNYFFLPTTMKLKTLVTNFHEPNVQWNLNSPLAPILI